MLKLAITIAIAPTILSAQSHDIQNHDIQILFANAPCNRIVQMIDDPNTDLHNIGMMAMAFGFLMGFEIENPGIRGNHETILKRLRNDCDANSKETALAMLRRYAAENQ